MSFDGALNAEELLRAAGGERESFGPGYDKAKKEDNMGGLPPILSARQFMNTFVVPDYLIDGIIQRGRLYAITSPTGHGKTAVALYFGCMVAINRNVGSIEVDQGDVLFLAGENPDDLCARVHAACQVYGLDPDKIPLHVMPGTFPVTAEAAELLKQKINATGRATGLIIADSLAAYFGGDNENDNVQMGAYARHWRVLTGCNGNPAVVALAHPIKAASRENLLPRGGGAFLAELDANLTLWAEGERETTTLHWQGKIRGVDFQPVNFALTPTRIAGKLDKKGRPFVSVVATLQTAEQAETALHQAVTNENVVLEWLRRHPKITMREIARNAGWVVGDEKKPDATKVLRLLKSLEKEKMVLNQRHKWHITALGRAELDAVQ